MNSERRGLRLSGFVPVEARLHAPAIRHDLAPRRHLVDRLLESRPVPVVSVTAPLGSGKTVVVCQWASEDDRPFAWLTLAASEDDPVVLVTYLLYALQRLEPLDPVVVAVLGDGNSGVDEVVSSLATTLVRRQHPFVLVLDGTDVLTSEASHAVLRAVADSVPDGSQVVLLARAAVPLDLVRLRADGQLLELGIDDLRLSRTETLAVIEAAGADPTGPAVDDLLRRTEGWAAGTYLMALWQVSAGRSAEGEQTAASGPFIAGYLRDDLLRRLAPADQEFLVRVSILAELTGALCDAVLETADSGRTLERLARANALVLALPARPEWFRLHPMLAEVLRHELLRRPPGAVNGLHARASRWLEEAGHHEKAAEQAIAAGDVPRAARLIWGLVPALLGSGRLDVVEGWLSGFPPRQVAAHAKLAASATACALQRGAAYDYWLDSVERGRYEQDRPGEAESVQAAGALFRCVVAQQGIVQMRVDADRALSLFAPDDPWRGTAALVAGAALYLLGDLDEAAARLGLAEAVAAAAGAHAPVALMRAELALIALDRGDPEEARRQATAAATLVRDHDLADLATIMLVRCLSALMAAEEGRRAEAAELAKTCRREVAVAVHLPSWLCAQARLVLARAELGLGERDAARALLSDAQAFLAHAADATWLRAGIERAWREADHLPAGDDGGAATLTRAELRVLQYLPTHQSFEEIGRQLFVSRNTVKTQAVSAYRKLGVNSRAEAVERAAALGLIQR